MWDNPSQLTNIFQKGLTPPTRLSFHEWFMRGNPIKMDDLGVPPF